MDAIRNDPRTDPNRTAAAPAPRAGTGSAVPVGPHEPPRFRVIPLDCEITAYAPDGDQPLF